MYRSDSLRYYKTHTQIFDLFYLNGFRIAGINALEDIGYRDTLDQKRRHQAWLDSPWPDPVKARGDAAPFAGPSYALVFAGPDS